MDKRCLSEIKGLIVTCYSLQEKQHYDYELNKGYLLCKKLFRGLKKVPVFFSVHRRIEENGDKNN